MGKAKERSSLTHRATIYQVDPHCPREAETGLADEAITELNAVRALEGDFRLICDPAFRPATSFKSGLDASKRAVAPEEPNVLLRWDHGEHPARTTSFVTFLPTAFFSETESGFWNSISCCIKMVYLVFGRWRSKCYFHSGGSWGMPCESPGSRRPKASWRPRMRIDLKRNYRRRDRTGGFSLIELLIVVFVVMVVAAIAVPNILLAVSNIRLRASAGDLAGLMQQARIMAAKNNPTTPIAVYPVRYGVRNGAQIAYIDLNGDGAWSPSVTVNGVTLSEPLIEFSGTAVPAAGAPSGTGGQPSQYVLAGDTVIGGASFDNTKTIAFTPRGFPCDYSLPPTCSTPAATYFVHYLTDTRIGGAGWAAVVVTKAGRTKVVNWNGSLWN